MIRYSEPTGKSPVTTPTTSGIMIHEQAEDMPQLPIGRFAHMAGDDRIFALACGFPSKGEPGAVHVSSDMGATWDPVAPFCTDGSLVPTDSGAFMCTREGTLIAAFSNRAEISEFTWDPELKDAPRSRLPSYVARSLDGGESWQDIQKLHDDWTGANRDMIQTRSGRVVFSSMKLLHSPGRHTVLTYGSDDDGGTWTPSNVLDLGGNGHHDGLTEASVLELRDNRLLKYIRTNWGELWRAYSADEGHHWHVHGPAGLPASSTPPFLERLASGRIVLLWNRSFPEGEDSWPMSGGDGIWSATPASNFRHELSMSFSEDECESWSPPVVIARSETGEVCYPYAFEAEPGVLWITAHRFGLRMCLREGDFAG